MRVFVLARTEHEITQQLYPALADTEARIVGYATSTEGLAEQLEIAQPDRVLVKMTLCRPGEEEVFLERLARYRLIVVLPRGRGALAESLSALPHVQAVAAEPADYAELLEKAAAETVRSQPQGAEEPSKAAATDSSPGASVVSPDAGVRNNPAPSPQSSSPPATPTERAPVTASRRVRRGRVIAFTSGMLGGTGKNTLAGNLAWLLAHEGKVTTILLCFGAPPAACGTPGPDGHIRATHTYETSSWDKPPNGPRVDLEKRIVPDTWDLESYQVSVPTYWVVEWRDRWYAWEPTGKIEWGDCGCWGGGEPTNERHHRGCVAPHGICVNPREWYGQTGEPEYDWTLHDTGWHGIDLRDCDHPTWYQASYSVVSGGDYAGREWWGGSRRSVPTPILEVQSVLEP